MQEDIVCFCSAGPDPVAVMLQDNMVQKLFTSSFKRSTVSRVPSVQWYHKMVPNI